MVRNSNINSCLDSSPAKTELITTSNHTNLHLDLRPQCIRSVVIVMSVKLIHYRCRFVGLLGSLVRLIRLGFDQYHFVRCSVHPSLDFQYLTFLLFIFNFLN